MDSGRSSPVNLSRSSSLRLTSSNGNRTSLVRRNQSMSAKQIRFYRNGDRYFSGLKLAVSSERYKEFESLLAELSEKLNLSSGAVRFIFNAEDNSMITDITQLQYGVPYVCSSTNSFRSIEGGYGKHLHSWSVIAKSKQMYKPNILGNIENYQIINNIRNENGREYIKPKLVTVIRNGKPPQKKVTLLLNGKTAISLNQVLDQLSAKGSLGKVDKLFTIDGRVVKGLRDLFDDDTVFIAMSTNEKFPDDGIELDPNSYRITPYRELKRPSNMSVRRSNSLRHSMSHSFKHDENLSISRLAKNMRPKNMTGNSKGLMTKVSRPKSSNLKKMENTEELYPTSVFETDSSDSDCEYEIYSMFGIKKDRTSIHSVYKIGRIIGDGNFAIVRECRNRKSQKSFALKVINKAKVKGKEHMIENEILILRRISHPNIVRLHEEFETPKEIFLVMELVAGGDLFDAIVANTRFSEPESAYMIKDLASAVHYLHQLDIVHRDIKPENLLVVNRPDGRKSIKLADFGLSIQVKCPMFLVCGTPTYVAPEILDESGYGIKVDVWAIGVICYILLCGFPPFRSTNHDQEELFDKILNGDFEYLSPFWDDVTEGPRDLIDRLLVVDPSERFDANEILTHTWVKKWTEPSLPEKLHRELSQADEANKQNRKRLRGIAIAIHSNLRKNQPYITQSQLSPDKDHGPIDEQFLVEHSKNTNDNNNNTQRHRTLSKTNSRNLSDDEHVLSSDDNEEPTPTKDIKVTTTPRRQIPTRQIPRPISFPCALTYQNNVYHKY